MHVRIGFRVAWLSIMSFPLQVSRAVLRDGGRRRGGSTISLSIVMACLRPRRLQHRVVALGRCSNVSGVQYLPLFLTQRSCKDGAGQPRYGGQKQLPEGSLLARLHRRRVRFVRSGNTSIMHARMPPPPQLPLLSLSSSSSSCCHTGCNRHNERNDSHAQKTRLKYDTVWRRLFLLILPYQTRHHNGDESDHHITIKPIIETAKPQ